MAWKHWPVVPQVSLFLTKKRVRFTLCGRWISNLYYQLATFESCKTCDGAISDDFILLTFDHSNYEFKEILNE